MLLEPGMKFTRLTLIEPVSRNSHRYWLVVCECTPARKFIARSDKLRAGRIKSCGCLQAELNEDARKQKQARLAKKDEALYQQWLMRQEAKKLKEERELSPFYSSNLDFKHFDQTGDPKEVAWNFKAWAYLVTDVLKWGPQTDSVTVKVQITMNPRKMAVQGSEAV